MVTRTQGYIRTWLREPFQSFRNQTPKLWSFNLCLKIGSPIILLLRPQKVFAGNVLLYKALLIINNSPSHPRILEHANQNINIVFLLLT